MTSVFSTVQPADATVSGSFPPFHSITATRSLTFLSARSVVSASSRLIVASSALRAFPSLNHNGSAQRYDRWVLKRLSNSYHSSKLSIIMADAARLAAGGLVIPRARANRHTAAVRNRHYNLPQRHR